MNVSRILCALSIAIISSVSLAQDITDVEAKPYGSYTGSAIDTVDLVTGNLMLHIPLVSYPQKGTLPPLSFSVELNNAPYVQSGGCDGNDCLGTTMYDTSPPGAAYIFPQPNPGEGYQFQNRGAYITSSFAGGIVTGQSETAAGPTGPVLVYNLIDPDGTTHELESDSSSPNTYRTPDGSGYAFLPNDSPASGSSPAGDAYDLYNSDNLGMGSSDPTYSQSTNYWLYVPQDNNNPFDFTSGSGVRLGTILTPTGVKYSSTISPSFSMSVPVFPTQANTCHALTTTATDPTGNTITRSLWYWSGCASGAPFTDIATDYAGFSHPSGYAAGPYYVDSVKRVIPDILTTQATMMEGQYNDDIVPWTVPGPGGNTLTYLLQYTHIYNSEYSSPPLQMWNGGAEPDPSVAISGDNLANGFALSSITLPSSFSSSTGQWQFIYSPQELGQTVAGDPNFYYCTDNCAPATGPDLVTVKTPTGAEIDYQYTTIVAPSGTVAGPSISRCNGNCHAVRTRTVSDGNGNSYQTQYTYGSYSLTSPLSGCTTVLYGQYYYAVWTKETDSLGNDTVHSFCALDISAPMVTSQYHEIETQYFQGSASLGATGFAADSGLPPLKTVTTPPTSWQYQADIQPPNGGTAIINARPTQVITTTPVGSTTEVKTYSQLFSAGRAYCPGGCSTSGPAWWPSTVYPYPQIAVSYLSPTSDTISTGSTQLRSTTTQFEFQNSLGSAYAIANMIGLPLMERSLDPSNNVLSQTTYSYDNYNYGPNHQNLISGETSCGNPTQSPDLPPCGDLTTTTRSLNTGQNVTTTTAYAQGMPILKTDANGNQTSITYQCQGMYPLTVTKAYGSTTTLPETTSYTYDCATSNPQTSSGVVTSVTDPNGVNTTYSYALSGDSLGRLTQVQYGVVTTSSGSAAQSTTFLYYPSMTEVDVSQEQSPSTSSSPWLFLTSKTVYDGLGRTIQQTNPAAYIVNTTYADESTRPFTVSNPSPTGGNPSTDGTMKYSYDALGRVVQKTNQDNTTALWCYDSVPDISLSPSNNQPTSSGALLCSSAGSGVSWVNSMDESGNPHQQSYDGVGQLIAVTEPNPNTGSLTMTAGALGTAYTYDGLGNLTKVVQSGASSDTSARTRTFTYDSLSRLICAANPENSLLTANCPTTVTSPFTYTAGTTGYTYDANSNLSSKTDARGVSVTYAYDGLNRLLSKTYATGSTTPASCYQYDQTSIGSFTITNPTGHLTSEWTQAGGCPSPVQLPASGTLTSRLLLGYDFMGRLTSEEQCTSLTCTTPYSFAYGYDLLGHVTSASNGLGSISWQPQYDSAGRLAVVNGVAAWSDPQFPSNLFGLTTYGPAGITQWSMPGLTFYKNYDTRLRVTSEQVTGNQPNQ